MFFLIGLGLGDAKDVTVKGLEIIRKCERVYLEAYTSILTVGKEALEEFYGRQLILADRDMCEIGTNDLLAGAKESDVALLVVGDPLGATTHTDMLLRAKQMDISYQVVHNASIMNAVGCCGLQLYSFGETVSIPYWTESWKPDSFMSKMLANFKNGLHTLCLLDIKVKEPTEESLTRKVKVYMEPKFMSVKEAAQQILAAVNTRRERGDTVDIDSNTLLIGLSRVGSPQQRITACSLEEMCACDLGAPLHSLVLPAKALHPLEEDFVAQFRTEHS